MSRFISRNVAKGSFAKGTKLAMMPKRQHLDKPIPRRTHTTKVIVAPGTKRAGALTLQLVHTFALKNAEALPKAKAREKARVRVKAKGPKPR